MIEALLIAQAAWNIGHWAIFIIVALAIVGVVLVAVHEFAIPVPAWVWKIIGIIIVAMACIAAVKFLLTL